MTKRMTILITGASSGIGRALALACANKGWRVLLLGRNKDRLDSVAQQCQAQGGLAETAAIRVEEQEAMKTQLLAWDEAHAIDIAVANAGISGGGNDDEEKLREILRVNLDGVFNTIHPLIPKMKARGRGHIVLMSSMAGFRGLPNAPAYSVSKVAVRALGDALRPLLKADGVFVSTIFPGFVRTPLTDVNRFPMPFLIEPEEAARIILRGIEERRPAIAFPWPMHVLCWLLSIVPRRWSDWVLSCAPKKS